jgi:hypothetical protein
MWLLTLTTAAKRFVREFLVLGVLLFIGTIALSALLASSTANAIAGINQLNDSANTLSGKIATWDRATTNCGQNLSCITTQDATLAAAFNAFSGQLSGISLPFNTTADKNKLNADTLVLAQDFTKLSQATSADQYNSTLNSIGLQRAIDTWSTDATTLQNAV